MRWHSRPGTDVCRHAGFVGLAFSVAVFALTLPLFAQAPPSTGTAVADYAPLDQAVVDFMDRIDCQAGVAAVSREGKLKYSRGFGWSDAHKKKPTSPESLMRIAGLTQPITAAAVKKLIREGKLALDTRVFPLLKLKPPRGSTPDPRLNQITVGQLLENKGGWDAASSFDPFARLPEIQKSLKLSRRPRQADVIRYMLGEPLQFDPGQRTAASNFGYCVLGRVIEKASGKAYGNYIADDIFQPLGVDDFKLARSLPSQRDAREVWYPVKDAIVETTDSYGGLIASAPALCKFLEAYWANGDPRRPGEDLQWAFFGNFAGTTAYICQRPDGYNLAILFNGGRKESLQEEDDRALAKSVGEALDKVAAASSK
jgi:CubicO group peptidase (beta-lactamase class C family)